MYILYSTEQLYMVCNQKLSTTLLPYICILVYSYNQYSTFFIGLILILIYMYMHYDTYLRVSDTKIQNWYHIMITSVHWTTMCLFLISWFTRPATVFFPKVKKKIQIAGFYFCRWSKKHEFEKWNRSHVPDPGF